MQRVSGVMRILSTVIDVIVVSVPVIFIMMMYFGVSGTQADMMMELLLAVYGVLMIHYFDGATLGKRIGRMKVMTSDGVKVTLMEAGMRELMKCLYLIPLIGWVLAVVSTLMLFFGDGRTIHDRVSGTRVIYIWNQPEVEQDEH